MSTTTPLNRQFQEAQLQEREQQRRRETNNHDKIMMFGLITLGGLSAMALMGGTGETAEGGGLPGLLAIAALGAVGLAIIKGAQNAASTFAPSLVPLDQQQQPQPRP